MTYCHEIYLFMWKIFRIFRVVVGGSVHLYTGVQGHWIRRSWEI